MKELINLGMNLGMSLSFFFSSPTCTFVEDEVYLLWNTVFHRCRFLTNKLSNSGGRSAPLPAFLAQPNKVSTHKVGRQVPNQAVPCHFCFRRHCFLKNSNASSLILGGDGLSGCHLIRKLMAFHN